MTSVLDDFTRKLKSSTLDPLETYKDMAYHYTSIANIDSILPKEGRARLWASRHDCLNDASEGRIPEIRFKQASERLAESGKIDERFYALIHDVRPNRTDLIVPTIDGKTRPARSEFKTYVTSFSEDPDALAMWNYYSKGNRYEGVSIGFSLREILDSLDSALNADRTMKVRAAKVVYDEEEQLRMIERAILDPSNNYEPRYGTSVRYCIATLLTDLQPLFKLDCFSHEKEVRLYVKVFDKFKAAAPVNYRSSVGYMIPYVNLDFEKEAVFQITLAPSLDSEGQKKLQREVVREMLEVRGYQPTVKHSEIPVRY